jgi:hypothetical protein
MSFKSMVKNGNVLVSVGLLKIKGGRRRNRRKKGLVRGAIVRVSNNLSYYLS